jgi:hypothetical protein
LFRMTMKVLTNIFCLLLVALTFAILADVVQAKSNDVVTLDATNFNAVCSKHKRILALFTDSKCEACTKFGPHFADLSREFASSKDELIFAQITCRKDSEALCKQFKVDKLPTMIVIDEYVLITKLIKHICQIDIFLKLHYCYRGFYTGK